jgi:O-antigen ligase
VAGRPEETVSRGRHQLAFAGLYLLALLMYLRPQEVMPGLFGSLQLAQVVAISTILIYIVSKLSAGEQLMIWPLEMKMMVVMWVMGLLLMPVAVSPQDSFNVLFDPLIKTLLVFVLLINLIDTRARLRALLGAMVFCELLFAAGAIKTYLTGGYGASFSHRISGWGTMIGNPNDLASVLNVLLPFTVIFALQRRGWARWFYFACAGLVAIAVLLTFSRSGFIGLVAAGGVLAWKLARGHRVRILFAAAGLAVVLLMVMPGTYWVRLATISIPEADTTHSAQERQLLMKRAAELALKRSIVGVGMGNFHIYSLHEKAAHNSYLETTAELGVIGLIAYLVLIFAPIRSLRRIEQETASAGARPEPEIHLISVCLQASFVAYIVYGFFGSVQYMYFLYFSVAYAVALRRIHSAESCEAAGAGEGAGAKDAHAQAHLTRGVLWRPQRYEQPRLIGGSR